MWQKKAWAEQLKTWAGLDRSPWCPAHSLMYRGTRSYLRACKIVLMLAIFIVSYCVANDFTYHHTSRCHSRGRRRPRPPNPDRRSPARREAPSSLPASLKLACKAARMLRRTIVCWTSWKFTAMSCTCLLSMVRATFIFLCGY